MIKNQNSQTIKTPTLLLHLGFFSVAYVFSMVALGAAVCCAV